MTFKLTNAKTSTNMNTIILRQPMTKRANRPFIPIPGFKDVIKNKQSTPLIITPMTELYNGWSKHSVSDLQNASRITEHIFLGGCESICHKNIYVQLIKHNIGLILNMAKEVIPERDIAESKDISYHHVPLIDSSDEDIKRHFDECFKLIDETIKSGKNVLVNCQMGFSRSATIVIAYLMYKLSKIEQKTSYMAVYSYVSKRRETNPNLGFALTLRQFECELNNEEVELFKSFDDDTDELLNVLSPLLESI